MPCRVSTVPSRILGPSPRWKYAGIISKVKDSIFVSEDRAKKFALHAKRDDDVDAGQHGESNHDDADYIRAIVENVGRTSEHAPIIFLKMNDGSDLVLPVFIGEAECTALLQEIRNQRTVRPMTHDLMKNMLELLDYKILRVCVTDMRENTYFAIIFVSSPDGSTVKSIDARPSDAINLALRFQAPIFVNKAVVQSSAYLMQGSDAEGNPKKSSEGSPEVENELFTKVQQQALRRKDPALELRSRLAMAVAEERYDDAVIIQEQIGQKIGNDHIASLLYQMEQAISEERYQDAARIRDELQTFDETEEKVAKIVFDE